MTDERTDKKTVLAQISERFEQSAIRITIVEDSKDSRWCAKELADSRIHLRMTQVALGEAYWGAIPDAAREYGAIASSHLDRLGDIIARCEKKTRVYDTKACPRTEIATGSQSVDGKLVEGSVFVQELTGLYWFTTGGIETIICAPGGGRTVDGIPIPSWEDLETLVIKLTRERNAGATSSPPNDGLTADSEWVVESVFEHTMLFQKIGHSARK